MKIECYSCGEKVHTLDGDYCWWCGQFICNHCSTEHKTECYNTDFDIDAFGNCYSDADPSL